MENNETNSENEKSTEKTQNNVQPDVESNAEPKPAETRAPSVPTFRKPRQGARRAFHGTDSEFIEKVISINRVTKVTKGGKKLSFSALVVVGNGKGQVGYHLGKANEVATAIRKALSVAKKNMINVPMSGSTIPHQINGVCGGALVMLKPASEGTGVIASGPVRAVCDAVGIHNILTKSHRSNNPINVVKATVNGLYNLKPKIKPVEIPEETEDATASTEEH